MKKAIIDLGTNTFNLLIAEIEHRKFAVLHAEKIGVAIGMGGINKKIITEDSMLRGMNAIGQFLDVCKKYEVERISAFGTSALRDAGNTEDFRQKIWQKFNLSVNVISGAEEAKLIYNGVKQLFDFEEDGAIIDIGGGSTEIILASRNYVREVASLNIGVSRIYQMFDLNDPLTPEDIEKIRFFLQDNSEGFFANRNEPLMVGSSGSFETFWELIHLEKFPKEARIYPLEMEIFQEVLKQTIASTMKERDANPYILPIRKLMAPITAVKTLWLMEKLKTKEIIISPFSLKEGALLSEDI